MSSLLPFHFGHRSAYFAVEVTLHELQDVPLISGRFQAKWRVRNPHQYSAHLSYTSGGGAGSGTSTPAGSQLARIFHKDIQEAGKQTDQHGDDHSVHSRQDDASSGIYNDEEAHGAHQSSSNFLSGIFHRRQRKEQQHPDSPHHSTGAPGRSSFDTEQSGSPRKDTSTGRSREIQHGNNQHLSDAASGSMIPSNFHAEPRGASEWEEVDEHSVKWGRSFHSGIRVAIDKTKAGAQQPQGSSADSGYDSKGLRSRSSHRDLRSQEDKEEPALWGLLGNSELKVTIRQDVQTDSHSSSDAAPLGVVVLNLAEYAPCPQTAAHTHLPHQHHSHDHHHSHHHHQHHHHHHQHNHQHSQHSTSTLPPPLPQLRRQETRRYLLQESKTNASLKISIKITHIGGSREYTVPPIRRGLVMGGLRSESEQLLKHSRGNDSESEQSGSHNESKTLQREPSSASIRHFSDRRSQKESSTLDKLAAGSKSTRIPSKNLKNGGSKKERYVSHHSSSTAPVSSWNALSVSGKGRKRAQLQSLAFAFSGSGNWERDPSEVIDAIFAAHTTADGKSAGEPRKPKSKPTGLSAEPMHRSSSQYSHRSTSTHGNDKASLASRRQSGGSIIRPLVTKSLSSSPSTSLAQLSPIKRLRPSTTSSVASSSAAPPSPSLRPDAKEESGTATPERSQQRIKWDTRQTDASPAPDGSSSAMANASDSPGPHRRASDDALASRGDGDRNRPTSASAQSSPLQRRSALSKDSSDGSFSGSTPDALSPSASTIMQDEATPMPSRVTSVALAKYRQGLQAGKGDQETDDGGSEAGETVVGQDSRPGRIKKKKSKGLIGIRPSDAEKMGFKGAGWKSSGLRVGFALGDNDDVSRGRWAKSSAPAIPERDESPKGTKDEESAQEKQERRSPPSPRGGGRMDDAREAGEEEEPDSPVLALRSSLSPYVEARLGRPRSKVGLRSTSVGSTPKGFARSSMETVSAFSTSATGGPGPHVLQGQNPLPSRISNSDKDNDVPALIPGAAPTKFAPETGDAGENDGVGYDSRRSSAATGSGASGRASSSEQHDGQAEKSETGPATALAPVPVWADAQTELEAQFDKRGVYALLSPPPLPRAKSYFSKENATAANASAAGSSAAESKSPTSSLHSGVAIGRGRERALSITSGASTARSTLLDRPDGVPAPAAFVIRQMEEEQEKFRLEQQKRREEGGLQSKKKEKEKEKKEKKGWMMRG
ncbi:hypothetical protein BCV69DRAFT_281039 [Microstroma glucosiphilum]|uniref:C2 NT-type domain-containing protein n=1 Tax=Pseudomicrostroma glucosiphilum TaxID=1684307 RepID=A0A316UE17_9BASI|nr:hypothetical protein BCV69DRAFT_281039 [Pseudomicrostroma glucosiphilum]PWN23422.1 hypothetical protein BCV69DRAFT_281039 [Pseudomicrostroma glucosiphilum]